MVVNLTDLALKITFIKLAYGYICRIFSILLSDEATVGRSTEATVGSSISRQAGLGYIKTVAEKPGQASL